MSRATRRPAGLAVGVACLMAVVVPVRLAAQTTLDLAMFLRLVEENSLALAEARTSRALAEVQEDLARSQIYPFIAGQVGYTRNFSDIEQDVPVAADISGGGDTAPLIYQPIEITSDNELQLGISLQQNIFDVSVFRALEASSQFTDLTATGYEAARQQILTGAKKLFYQVLLLEEVLLVREASEAIALDSFEDARRRFDTGLASQLEVLQAEVNWKIAQPETTQARRNLAVALQQLANFAGIDRAEIDGLDGSLADYPALPGFDGAYETRDERPDYRALLGEARLRELNIAAQRATFYPSLAATINYGIQFGSDDFTFSDGQDSLTAGLNLTIPIFYGGSRFARVEQARLELAQTRTAIALKDEEIETELETIRLTLEEAALRIESAEQTVATAERAFEVTQTSVDSGLATQLELDNARNSLESARLNRIAAVFDYLSAYFDWQLAVGRGDAVE